MNTIQITTFFHTPSPH